MVQTLDTRRLFHSNYTNPAATTCSNPITTVSYDTAFKNIVIQDTLTFTYQAEHLALTNIPTQISFLWMAKDSALKLSKGFKNT